MSSYGTKETYDLYECQNCGQQWHLADLKEVPTRHYHERVAEDEPEPAGECPECGALCHKRVE